MRLSFPDAAERYALFRERIFEAGRADQSPAFVREPFRPSESELEIQARWFGGEFGREFVGSEGEKIEIVQFGHWNRAAGPDFTEPAVRINGELKAAPHPTRGPQAA